MTFKFSDKDQTIRIYNLRADTKEFIGAGDAYIPAGTGLPADCTDCVPPEVPTGKAAVFDGEGWILQDDHRGETLYCKETGQQVTITELGDLPENVTLLKPDDDFMRWVGSEWVKDTEAEYKAAVAQAEEEKKKLLQESTLKINILQDAADLGIATTEESKSLLAWKKYRIELNRFEYGQDWPSKPDV
ncbi:tail fiber assembly protein [Enterobacter ludwigii]|uniref:tail fiber assembly protein n=1 Tax=Enterobacter ludwigii TaxID=299767 RepID=UPI00397546E4